MTDLRTRIAAAIQSIRIQRAGDAARMADAVIRELGWRREVDDKSAFRMEPSRTRYVTEWKTE